MTAHVAEHDRLHELVGLYVLDAISEVERLEFERHLETCPDCASEARSLRAVSTALPYAVPLIAPPASLRARVLEIAHREDGVTNVIPLTPRAASPRASLVSSGWLSAAALLVASIGLGAYTLSLREQMFGLRAELRDAMTRLERSEEEVTVATRNVANAESRMAVLIAPDMTQVDLQGQPVAPAATGRAFLSRSRGMVFTASNLPPLPAGRAYQLWVVTAQAPVSAGILQLGASGHVAQAFNTPADLAPAVAVAVTIEPEGGVPAPTGDRYLVGLTH